MSPWVEHWADNGLQTGSILGSFMAGVEYMLVDKSGGAKEAKSIICSTPASAADTPDPIFRCINRVRASLGLQLVDRFAARLVIMFLSGPGTRAGICESVE